MRKGKAAAKEAGELADLPDPALPSLERPWGILVTGVGGTGVVTIGALLGMAGHLEGKGSSVAISQARTSHLGDRGGEGGRVGEGGRQVVVDATAQIQNFDYARSEVRGRRMVNRQR